MSEIAEIVIMPEYKYALSEWSGRTNLVTRLGGTLIVLLLGWSTVALAAPKPTEFPNIGYDANLTIEAVPGTNDHELNWIGYEGSFSVFGYDVYYGTAPSAPGANAGRIATGATGTAWTDIDGKSAGRCEPSDYYIVAYGRGRKDYSDPAQGSGINVCNAPDEIPPVVSITQPSANQNYLGSQLFSGTASDTGGSGVESVTISVDNLETGDSELYNPVLSAEQWVVNANLVEGSYLLSAFASDKAGNTSIPEIVDFTVEAPVDDTTNPVITVSSPEAGQEFTTSAQIFSGNVDDFGGSGVAAVQIEISGTQALSELVLTSGDIWTFSANLPNGDYQLDITANDRAGNPAPIQSRLFAVNKTVDIGEDGYTEIESCPSYDPSQRTKVSPSVLPSFENTFDSNQDIHVQLQQNWKSAYEWRQSASDVIINNESQFYLDVLGLDAQYRQQWSPFELLKDQSDNGYLAISAVKKNVLPAGPVVNGAMFADQDYLSGVLSTFGKHSLSPSSALDGKVIIELKARMPRGQGVFPAAWLYNESFFRNNPEIDIFEYVGQSPNGSGGWARPSAPECGAPCVSAGRENYDTFHTQYHNVYISDKGKLKGLGATSVDNNGDATGAVYTNPDSNSWWRGSTWGGCAIDFSEKFHTYTLEWSAEEIVWYIDDVEVLRLDEQADSGGNLPRVNFVPVDTRSMYLTLNFALGSVNSYIGAPDDYTKASMDDGDLRYIIDYIKVWY